MSNTIPVVLEWNVCPTCFVVSSTIPAIASVNAVCFRVLISLIMCLMHCFSFVCSVLRSKYANVGPANLRTCLCSSHIRGSIRLNANIILACRGFAIFANMDARVEYPACIVYD
jgi:hypothetical protein